MTTPVHVLMVCTGNICRSPAAELLLASALGGDSGIVVGSAGTAAPEGSPISATVADLLRADGIDASGHRARWLTEEDVRSADLVLGMTRDHRGRAVSLAPAAVRRTFTLLEFARIVSELPPNDRAGATPAVRLRAMIAAAPRHRRASGADDIEDPYRLGPEINALVYAEIDAAIDTIKKAILG